MKQGCFYGVGLGPGDPGLVTLRAAEILRRADVIYAVASRQTGRSVSAALVRAIRGEKAPLAELEFVMADDPAARRVRIDEHAARIAADLAAGRDAAFATIGDALTYSCCSYLLAALRRRVAGLRWEVVPGVNSWSLLAARTGTALAEDREILEIVPEFDRAATPCRTTVHLKPCGERDAVLAQIPASHQVIYGEELGLAGEFVTADRRTVAGRPKHYLSMLIEKRGDTEELL